MAADFTIDLIDGDYEKTNDNGRIIERATRVALVYGLNGTATPANALITARAMIEAAHPLGEAYDVSSFARIVSYRSEGIQADDGAVRVRIFYDIPFGDGSSSGEPTWLVEDDSEDQIVDTQIDRATGNPLELKWTNPTNAADVRNDMATVGLPQTWRKLILTGVLTVAQVNTYRISAGRVNQAAFMGLPKGYWWYRSLRTHTRVGAGFYYASCELVTKQDEDWATYAIYRDPDGKWVLPGAAVVSAIVALPYQFGVQSSNGILKIGGMQTEDFPALFNITVIP